MASTFRPDDQREIERQAWDLRRKGWTQEQIANRLGVAQATISRALARVEKRLLARLTKRADRVKARQTAQLEHLISEAMGEWERSKKDAEKLKTVEEPGEKVADGTLSTVTKTETTVEGRIGDPRLLAQAREAMADIRKIWGADAPTKTDLTSGGKAVATAGPTVVEVRLNSGGTSREG